MAKTRLSDQNLTNVLAKLGLTEVKMLVSNSMSYVDKFIFSFTDNCDNGKWDFKKLEKFEMKKPTYMVGSIYFCCQFW